MSIAQPASQMPEADFMRQLASMDVGQMAEFEIQARRDSAMARVRANEREAARRSTALRDQLTAPVMPDTPLTNPFDPNHGRSLYLNDFGSTRAVEVMHHKGQVTRYDLVILPDGTHVKRAWLAGWYPWDKCNKAAPLKAGYTIHEAADELERQGWTVRRGKTWARAWRCGLRPVRVGNARRRWEERNGVVSRNLDNSLFDDKDPEETK